MCPMNELGGACRRRRCGYALHRAAQLAPLGEHSAGQPAPALALHPLALQPLAFQPLALALAFHFVSCLRVFVSTRLPCLRGFRVYVGSVSTWVPCLRTVSVCPAPLWALKWGPEVSPR